MQAHEPSDSPITLALVALEKAVRKDALNFEECSSSLSVVEKLSYSEDVGALSERIISVSQFFLFADCPAECKAIAFKILANVVGMKPKILLPHLKEFFVGDKAVQFFSLSSIPGFYPFLQLVAKSTRGLLKKGNSSSETAPPRPFTSLSDVIVSTTKQVYEFCCQQVTVGQSVEALETIMVLGTFNNFKTFLSLDQIDDLLCGVCFPVLDAHPVQAFRCGAMAGQSLRSTLLTTLKSGGSRDSFFRSCGRAAHDRDHILGTFIDNKKVPKATWGKLVYAFHNVLADHFLSYLEDVARRETPFLMLSYRKTFEIVHEDRSLDMWCGELEGLLWKQVVDIIPDCKEAEMKLALVQILEMVVPRRSSYPELELFPPQVVRCLQRSIDLQSWESEQIYEFFANNVKAVNCELMARLTNRIFAEPKIIAAQCRAIASILENREREVPSDYAWEIREILYGVFREVSPDCKFEGMPGLLRGIVALEKQPQFADSMESYLILRWALESEVPKLHWTIFNAFKGGRGDISRDLWEMVVDKAAFAYVATTNAKVAIAAGELLLDVDEEADGRMASGHWGFFQRLLEVHRGPPDMPAQYRERLRAVQRKLLQKYEVETAAPSPDEEIAEAEGPGGFGDGE